MLRKFIIIPTRYWNIVKQLKIINNNNRIINKKKATYQHMKDIIDSIQLQEKNRK